MALGCSTWLVIDVISFSFGIGIGNHELSWLFSTGVSPWQLTQNCRTPSTFPLSNRITGEGLHHTLTRCLRAGSAGVSISWRLLCIYRSTECVIIHAPGRWSANTNVYGLDLTRAWRKGAARNIALSLFVRLWCKRPCSRCTEQLSPLDAIF